MDDRPIKLNIGCGLQLLSGFINIDKAYSYKDLSSKKGFYAGAIIEPGSEYVQADVLKLPFPDNYADYIESVEMIEHLPFREVLDAIIEMRRVLKKGATIVLTAPNFDASAKRWVEEVVNNDIDFSDPKSPLYDLTEIIYGNQAASGEFHHVPLNPRYAYALFRNAGFEEGNINITAFPRNYPCGLIDLQTARFDKNDMNIVLRDEKLVMRAVK